jgi:two-component system, cell cycle sensor histidine kinase and response regulator CckA
MPKFARGLLGISLLGFGLHLFVLAQSHPRVDVSFAADILSVCLTLLAAAASFEAAREPNAYARSFWRLTGFGFILLATAELIGTYYENILHAPLDSVWPSDLLYFLFIAPMAMTLFLQPRRRQQGVDWAQALDFFQLAILVAAVYLYYFYLPSRWAASAQAAARLQWKFEVARNVFLIVTFAIRFSFVRSRLEWSLLSRLGGFLALFGLGSTIFLYRQNTFAMDSGSPWDLCYTVPVVAATIGACTWKLPTHIRQPEDTASPARESWGSLWMSLLLPLLVLAIATRIAPEKPDLAAIVVCVTLASAGARIVLTQHQQQRAAQATAEAEQKFHVLFEDNPQPTCLYDPESGRFLEINRAALEKYGYSREEFLRLTVADLCEHLLPERLAAARRGVEVRDEIGRQRRKDGSVIDVSVFARTIQFQRQSARLVVAQDITDRLRAQRLQDALYRIAEVSTSARDLNELYPAIHAIVADLLDARNFYIALYDRVSNWMTFPYFVDELDRPPAPRSPRRGLTEYVLRTGEPLLATAQKINELEAAGEVERAGSPADDWLGVPLQQGSKPFGVLAVQHYAARTRFGHDEKDVLTFVSHQVASAIERKRNEEALLRSEARYRSLIHSAVFGIFRATLDGRFLDVNPALVTMLGYSSAEEVLALNVQTDVFVADAAKAALQRSFLRRGGFEGVEARWRRKDGAMITVRLSGRGVRDEREGAEVLEVIAEDVTERKLLEEQLRQAQKMEAVGTLAGGVAHDFNNLLTVISGYSQILMEQSAGNKQLANSIDQIFHAADRAAALTRQLLAFSRRQMLQPQVVSLNRLITNVERMLQPLMGERIVIDITATPNLGTVKADPGQLEHIVMNMAVNARDAMLKGGTISIKTANVDLGEDFARVHAGATAGRYVMLSITDSGVGMDAETLGHIFEPFFTTKEPGKGTGLGLSTVYGIVKQSGGYITVDSGLGVGTTFRVYLPRLDEIEELPILKPAPLADAACSGTILLVEDEVAVRNLVEVILSSRGYHVLVADSPEHAQELCRTYRGEIDVLLTDVVMPGTTGPELAKQLLASRRTLKIIYMSGHAGEYLAEEGVNSEGVSLLQKPFTAAALEETIRFILSHGFASSDLVSPNNGRS